MEIPRQIEQLAELYAEAAEPGDPFGEAQRHRRKAFDDAVSDLFGELNLQGVTLRQFRKEVGDRCVKYLRRNQDPAARKAEAMARRMAPEVDRPKPPSHPRPSTPPLRPKPPESPRRRGLDR